MIGISETSAPAAISRGSWMNMPLSRFMPRVKVYLLSSEIAINGHRKSFQAPTNAKMPTTVIVPLTCGTQT